VFVEVGNTFRGGLSQVAQGEVGHRDALDYMGSYDCFGSFWGHVGVKDPGSVGELYVHQGFGETQAQTTYLADLSTDPVPLQGRMQGFQHGVATGGFAAESRAYSNPGRIPGSEGLPALVSFGFNLREGDGVLRGCGVSTVSNSYEYV
jgi:hypothetical protein